MQNFDTGIDSTHWLPDNMPIITAERIAKGDLCLDGAVIALEPTIIKKLVKAGHLEQWAESYVDTFFELQHAFLSPVRHKANGFYTQGIIHGQSLGHAASMYIAVTKEIGGEVSNIIEGVILRAKTEMNTAEINIYVTAVEVLINAIDNQRKKNID